MDNNIISLLSQLRFSHNIDSNIKKKKEEKQSKVEHAQNPNIISTHLRSRIFVGFFFLDLSGMVCQPENDKA